MWSRSFFTIVMILFVSISNHAQIKNFQQIEKYVKEIPESETKDIETLTQYLKKNAKTKTEIVARIYFWMVENIKYDWDAYKNNTDIDVSAEATLENRRSVCSGYANLFQAICDNAKIKCTTIIGYAKGYGFTGEKLTETNHAWNAVKLYDKWELIDVTWGKMDFTTNNGEEGFWNKRYFLDDPNDFILEHFPEDETWQLLGKEITFDEFFGPEIEQKRKQREIFWQSKMVEIVE